MYCQNCGKIIKNTDNFCKYCGGALNRKDYEEKDSACEKQACECDASESANSEHEEELVLYVAKKHWMGLIWPILLSPFFIAFFWKVYTSTHTMIGAIVGIVFLVPVFYPILRFVSDSMVVTNKFIHIKHGALDVEEINIPLKKAHLIQIKQTFLGKVLDYCYISFDSTSTKVRNHLRYLKYPEDLQYIINNPAKFVEDSFEEDPFISLSNLVDNQPE